LGIKLKIISYDLKNNNNDLKKLNFTNILHDRKILSQIFKDWNSRPNVEDAKEKLGIRLIRRQAYCY
jgi:hypothetical protein